LRPAIIVCGAALKSRAWDAGGILETARFGAFELDFGTNELHKNGRKIRLQEQPAKILKILVDRPGELVTREEIQARFWPNEYSRRF